MGNLYFHTTTTRETFSWLWQSELWHYLNTAFQTVREPDVADYIVKIVNSVGDLNDVQICISVAHPETKILIYDQFHILGESTVKDLQSNHDYVKVASPVVHPNTPKIQLLPPYFKHDIDPLPPGAMQRENVVYLPGDFADPNLQEYLNKTEILTKYINDVDILSEHRASVLKYFGISIIDTPFFSTIPATVIEALNHRCLPTIVCVDDDVHTTYESVYHPIPVISKRKLQDLVEFEYSAREFYIANIETVHEYIFLAARAKNWIEAITM